jgi:anti-anti-sigma factor
VAGEIQTKIQEKVLHVIFELPRLDASAMANLEGTWQLPDLTGVEQIDVDLRAVHFIDSSGVGFLLRLRRALPKDAPRVRLHHTHSSVRSVIEVLRLSQVFEFV